MTRKETDQVKLGPGNIWRNISELGEDPNWQQVPKPIDWGRTTEEILRPKIFSYEQDEFMRKQYK